MLVNIFAHLIPIHFGILIERSIDRPLESQPSFSDRRRVVSQAKLTGYYDPNRVSVTSYTRTQSSVCPQRGNNDDATHDQREENLRSQHTIARLSLSTKYIYMVITGASCSSLGCLQATALQAIPQEPLQATIGIVIKKNPTSCTLETSE